MTDTIAPPAFALPAALLSQGYRLRDETDGDVPFLIPLYASTREDELAQIPWTPEQKVAFLTQQFWAQRKHYYAAIENCRFWVIERDGTPIGRLYIQTTPNRMHVVDIALIPERRGGGLGTSIMRAVQDAAAATRRGVGIFVEKYNPAMNLYRRLGFTEIRDIEIHLEMEWLPPGVS